MNGKLLEKPRWSKGLNFFSPCLAREEEIHLSAAEATWRGKL